MMIERRIRAVGALMVIAILAAACSSNAATASPSTASPSTAVVPSVAASASTAASPSAATSPSATTSGAGIELKVGTGTVGSYLTGKDGMTLYTFKNDTVDSGKSVCNGGCATKWPPLVVSALTGVKPDSGVTGALTLATRDDGTKQVAYKGMPLYYYEPDTKAGDTMGQGVGGVWFVAAP